MSKRSCSSEGDKDLLTRRLALCLRHHSFGLRERFCLICTYAELTLTGFCTPPQCQLTRSNILQQNAMWSLSLPSGIRCGRGRGRRGSRRRGWICRFIPQGPKLPAFLHRCFAEGTRMRGQFFFKRAFGQWHVAACAVFLAKHEAFTSEKPLSFGGIVDYYSHKECLLTRALRVAYAELTRMPAVKMNLYLTLCSSQILKVNLKNWAWECMKQSGNLTWQWKILFDTFFLVNIWTFA